MSAVKIALGVREAAMGEAEWLACGRAEPMVRFLRSAGVPRRKGGRRKLRLFGCACVRRHWRKATDPRSRALVEAAERHADGLAGEAELAAAEEAALAARDEGAGLVAAGSGVRNPPWCLFRYADLSDADRPQPAWGFALAVTLLPDVVGPRADFGPEHRAQVALVREVFGNPFRPPGIGPACRTPTVVTLAQAAYEKRQLPSGNLDVVRLAVLADALEEAGCTDEDLLTHLRDPGPHVRGCWALDLILGKQ